MIISLLIIDNINVAFYCSFTLINERNLHIFNITFSKITSLFLHSIKSKLEIAKNRNDMASFRFFVWAEIISVPASSSFVCAPNYLAQGAPVLLALPIIDDGLIQLIHQLNEQASL